MLNKKIVSVLLSTLFFFIFLNNNLSFSLYPSNIQPSYYKNSFAIGLNFYDYLIINPTRTEFLSNNLAFGLSSIYYYNNSYIGINILPFNAELSVFYQFVFLGSKNQFYTFSLKLETETLSLLNTILNNNFFLLKFNPSIEMDINLFDNITISPNLHWNINIFKNNNQLQPLIDFYPSITLEFNFIKNIIISSEIGISRNKFNFPFDIFFGMNVIYY